MTRGVMTVTFLWTSPSGAWSTGSCLAGRACSGQARYTGHATKYIHIYIYMYISVCLAGDGPIRPMGPTRPIGPMHEAHEAHG